MKYMKDFRFLRKRLALRALITRTDLLLGAFGLLGLALWLWQRPALHPDRLADFGLGETEAIKQATAFANQQGYHTEGFTASATLTRSPALAHTLQAELGRKQLIAAYQNTPAHTQLPLFYWAVRWSPNTAEGSNPNARMKAGEAEVRLTTDGKVWEFRNIENGLPKTGPSQVGFKSALLKLEAQGIALQPTERDRLTQRLTSQSDSTARPLFYFDIANTLHGNALQNALHQPYEMDFKALLAGKPQPLNANAAAYLARQFLAQTIYPISSLHPDSISVQSNIATVRFSNPSLQDGHRVSVSVKFNSDATLLQIAATFTPAHYPNLFAEVRKAQSYLMLTFGIALVLSILVFVLVFFRRLASQLIDPSAALRDALFSGVAMFLVSGLTNLGNTAYSELGSKTETWTILLISVLISGFGSSILIFLISGATDSLSRDVWPEKLKAVGLVRRLYLMNQVVGLSLLRGLMLAAALAGLTIVVLWVFGDFRLGYSKSSAEGMILSNIVTSPFLFGLCSSIFNGVLVLGLVLLGIMTWLKRFEKQWLMLLGGGLAFMLTQAAYISLQPWYAALFIQLMLGLCLAWAFLKFDFFVAWVAYVGLNTMESLSLGWVAHLAPERLDFAFFLILFTIGLVWGFVSLFWGQDEVDLPVYVPPYVTEMANKKRIERELEIAHEVQQSFLPHAMPEIDGVTFAGRCWAAHETGGDYFDVIPLEGRRVALAVGDVSGKGIQAAFYMTLVKGFLQSLALDHAQPTEVLIRLNHLFRQQARAGMFISMIYGILDLEHKTFTFARAGHNPAILKRAKAPNAEVLKPQGMAIGLANKALFSKVLSAEVLFLGSGDTLVLYTDGFSEAMNKERQLFGDASLAKRIAALSENAPDAILNQLQIEVSQFTEGMGQQDDRTMLVFKIA